LRAEVKTNKRLKDKRASTRKDRPNQGPRRDLGAQVRVLANPKPKLKGGGDLIGVPTMTFARVTHKTLEETENMGKHMPHLL